MVETETNVQRIALPRNLDDRGIFILDLVEANDRLERENVDLRRDLSTVREILRASVDLNHKYHRENLTLRSYMRELRSCVRAQQAA